MKAVQLSRTVSGGGLKRFLVGATRGLTADTSVHAGVIMVVKTVGRAGPSTQQQEHPAHDVVGRVGGQLLRAAAVGVPFASVVAVGCGPRPRTAIIEWGGLPPCASLSS